MSNQSPGITEEIRTQLLKHKYKLEAWNNYNDDTWKVAYDAVQKAFFLLAENERLTKERDEAYTANWSLIKETQQLREELEQAKKERDELQEEVGDLKEANERMLDYELHSLRSQLTEKDKVQERMIQEIDALREYVGWHAANGSVDARQLLCNFTEVYPKKGDTKDEQ